MSNRKSGPRIYYPGPNIKEKIKSLKSAIVNRPPFCSGTVPLAASDLILYYGKPLDGDVKGEATSRRLDLTKASEEELQHLVDVCDQATFGLDRETVLDLSYRTAWKLDPEFFATKLNIVHAGLMDSIRYNLLTGSQGTQTFFAELYKLNVYGKGSFFKPHKDTPHSEKMFGSLVVVLPTVHEGGTLHIRHGGKEWKFESDTVKSSSITYVAFYGDVEHEVAEVKSGFRLTLTYNLYFGESRDSQAIVSTAASTAPGLFTTLPPHASTFQAKLAELLADETFLPTGGRLGFGLSHEYPFAKQPKLEVLTEVLKGTDAVIMQACRVLGLKCALNISYAGGREDDNRTVALCNFIADVEHGLFEEDEMIWQIVKDENKWRGVLLVNSNDDWTEEEANEEEEDGGINLASRGGLGFPSIDAYVHWVTKQTSFNEYEANCMRHYGNEEHLSCDYGAVCLIVSVGPSGRTSDPPRDV